MIRTFLNAFWTPAFWLPPNTTWEDVVWEPEKDSDQMYIYFYSAFILGFLLLLLRLSCERVLFIPLALSLGVKNTRSKLPENPTLEAAYRQSSKIKYKQVVILSKKTDLTERQVERWWRHRSNQDKPITMVKFCECFWRWLFYTYNSVTAMILFWNTEWFWDLDKNFTGFPHHAMENSHWWYGYMTKVFYCSLIMSQFFDTRRKDFWQMFTHHLITITLLNLNYICRVQRISIPIIVMHDISDVFLEAAKLAKYAKYQRLCDCLFVGFSLVWFVTRICIYPIYIIRTTELIPRYPFYYVFIGLMMMLLVLNIYWTWLIMKIVYRTVMGGKVTGDVRSSSSELSELSANSTHQDSPGSKKKA